MSSLFGWLGPAPGRGGVLEGMAGACGLPHAPLQTHVADDFTVAAASSVGGSAPQRLAVSDDGQVVVAFEGQLYDEDVTRKQLPAAYCLQLYQRHGPGFAVHLNGTFALAIHDRAAEQFHLISDRMASRALYYHTDAPLVFGTEVKFLLEYPGLSRKVNHDRLREFLVVELVPGTATYYDHFRQVPPATVLTWGRAGCSATKYWEARFTWDRHGSLDEHAEQIAAALRNSMRRVCAGHERIGLMLSGGMDSRTLACASASPLVCMTMHSRRDLEVTLASRIAAALGYPHHFIALGENYPLDLITPGSLIGDGMRSFQHAHSLLTRPLVEAQGLSLLLNGFALEGFFSGGYLPQGNEGGWRGLLPPAFPATIAADPAAHSLGHFRSAPDACLDDLLLGCSAAEVREGARRTMGEAAAGISAHALAPHDVISWLPLSNLSKLDTALNVSSIGRLTDEGLPVCDNEVVSAFLALPPAYQFHYRAYGLATRLLNAEVARIPRSWTGLPLVESRRWEAWHYYRAWAGVLTAELRARACDYRRHDRASWPRLRLPMRRSPDWHHALRQRLDTSYLVDTGVLDGEALRRLLEDQIAGRRNASKLIALWLTLEEWLTHYG